jgi:acyl transferase domain-containing protein
MQPIAIVGMACRFPGADGLAAYWKLLREGVDAVREVPADRWDHRDYPDASRWGGFLDGVDRFDPSVFGISPREAAYMDPQQRLLLEVAWEALEDAGLPLDRCAGRPVGVFVGISTYDYGALALTDAGHAADGYANTGGALSIAANRLSYLFDLRGPSLAIDTACSSSLAATHLACASLLRGESEMALAAGVNLILSPAVTVGFSKLKAMAADGRCKSFDAAADGFVRGEGAGVLVLKPLARAAADGDRIYAVIRGGALNQDGRTNGLTAPNGLSQEELIRRALADAAVEPSEITYLEAHGTGTALGDPIELTAAGAVLAEGRAAERPCAVGSVKTNIGHLEAAAGVAGVIKLALALQHREIPPSLHYREPNPHIPFDELRLSVQRSLAPWPEAARPARGGISSFGFGGTNVHLVLEEPPAVAARPAPAVEEPVLVPVSARNAEALPAAARALAEALRAPAAGADGPRGGVAGAALHDIAFTASRRRTHHEHRAAVAARSHEELGARLDALAAGEPGAGTAVGRAIPGRRRKLAFVFSGHGSQWAGMARGLLAGEPAFRASLERTDALVQRHAGWSVIETLQAEPASLDTVDVVQPALFAIQVGLAALWEAWGVRPDAIAGHSVGEIAAACVAGALDLEDAVRLVCLRGRLLQRTSGQGAMLAVELTAEEAARELAGFEHRACVAVLNAPRSTVISGDPEALDEIARRLEARGVFQRRVKSDVAFHGPQMEPLCGDLRDGLRELGPRRPAVPLFSSVTGAPAGDLLLDAAYWVRNLREPVRFASVVERLAADGHTVFLELSPHPVLLPAIRQTLQPLGKDGTLVASLRRDEDERVAMRAALGALFAVGRPVRWEALSPAGEVVRLPAYPWRRQRFWLEPSSRSVAPAAVPARDVPHPAAPALDESLLEPADGRDFRLELAGRGGPEQLVLREHTVPPPGAGEVQVTVAAAALSGTDLARMRSGGDSAAAPVPLAVECAGTIAAVGEGVSGWQDGDPVVALAWQAMGSRINTPASFVAARPADLRVEDAAALPLAYATARYALVHAAALRAGERVLVHPAAGGVGLAALRLARQIGAEVIATAPTREQRDLLRAAGASHVLDSGSAALAAEVASATGGTGVDVVLLASAGGATAPAWPRPGGRLVQLAPAASSPPPNRSSFVADVAALAAESAERFAALLAEAMGDAAALGTLPRRVFPVSEVKDAYRHLARGRHLGRVVVSLDDDEVRLAPAAAAKASAEDGQTVSAAAVLAAPAAERRTLLERHLQQRVARVLGMPAAQLDLQRPLGTLGIDSLMAVELKNRVESELGVTVPLVQVIQGPSVADLAALLLGLLEGAPAPPAATPPPAPDGARDKEGSLLLSLLAMAEERAGE